MLLDCLRRNERAYWKVLDAIKVDAEADAGMVAQIAAAVDAFRIERKQRKASKRESESSRELHWKEKITQLRQRRWDANKFLKLKISKLLNPLPVPTCTKAGVMFDAMAQVDSTSKLLVGGQDANWPERRPVEDPYAAGVAAMCNAITTEELEAAQDLINTRPRDKDSVRPLGVYNNDSLARSTLLLEDGKRRVYAWLNTHNAKSRFAKGVILKDMVNLRTGELVNKQSKTGDLFPLEFSDWHLDKFVRNGIMKSSKLIYRQGDFYVACTFLFTPEDIDTVNYLGVDRGIDKLVSWAAVTPDLDVIAAGEAEGSTLREYQRAAEIRAKQRQAKKGFSMLKWRAFGDHAIHRAANEIVKYALENKCQVVLEDLTAITQGPHHKRPKGQRRNNFARMLNRAQYGKLESCLNYKLPAAGLPAPVKVRAAFTSIICNACGHSDKANRPDQATFKCLSCAHEDNADRNAAKNISAKYIYWCEVGPKVAGKKMQDKHRFDNWMKERRIQV